MRDSISTGTRRRCVSHTYIKGRHSVGVLRGWNWISGLETCLFRFRLYANENIAQRVQSTRVIDSVPINYDAGKCDTIEMEIRRKNTFCNLCLDWRAKWELAVF